MNLCSKIAQNCPAGVDSRTLKCMLGLPDGARGCLFDLDGVLTQTARVHAAAWKRHVRAARDAGLRRAVASSSANCGGVLVAAGIEDLLEARIDGLVADREQLHGKPAPDTFLAGARALGLEPHEAVVFEDALAGVEAGRAGHFRYVVGVDRMGQADALKAHGADTVVTDLADLLDHS
jgi:beta-phosphoglucomutase-like phosphatase (HAD superfamily)